MARLISASARRIRGKGSRPCWNYVVYAVLLVLLCLPAVARAEEGRLPFAVGEKMTFQLRWGLICVGESVLEVLPGELNGNKIYHFAMTATTNSFADIFYSVRDRVDAFADLTMTHSLLYKKKQREGSTKRDISVQFDWDNNKAHYENLGREERTISLKPGTFDPLSIFYYARLLDLSEASVSERPATDGKKIVLGKALITRRETVRVPAGEFDTYVVEPNLKDISGVFEKSKKAKLELWLTADSRKLLVKMRSKVVVGSFVAELIAVEYGIFP